MPPDLPLVARAREFIDRVAVVAADGTCSYSELLSASAGVAAALLRGRRDLDGARVAYLLPPGRHHVAALLGIWRAGGVAVPLSAAQAPPEWQETLTDADADVVIMSAYTDARLEVLVNERRLIALEIEDAMGSSHAPLPAVDVSRPALMLYTSGTTAKPKGAVHTHASLEAQMRSLVHAWRWSAEDRILHVLPLHHTHGLINALLCALWSGAVCEMQPRFDADAVWDRLASGEVTLFMAVPTVYVRLIGTWSSAPAERRDRLARGVRAVRLMVSGSAALPATVLEQWRAITGHVLLERYGMTEIGMALSNPLLGERRASTVGTPLPGVDVRIVDESGTPVGRGTIGELEVRGATVFQGYWRRPDATTAVFHDGWFRTGDVAIVEDGRYRILGRLSVDIIKSGGYKVSALEIEEALRAHPDIQDCAVVGVEDPEWGERIAVAVVLRPGTDLNLSSLREWSAGRLARYKCPSALRVIGELPRNAIGKVTKPAVKAMFR